MAAPSPARSTNSEPAGVRGSVTPRLWTPELRPLTPETSFGFDVINFSRDVLGLELDAWQRWAIVHGGELLPDGRPRFRTVLMIVARQNGKTILAKVLIAYWLFVELIPLILGTSTDRSYAKRTWTDVCDLAKGNPWLAQRLGPGALRLTIGEESLRTLDGAEYTFAANNRRAGRSTTLHRWVADELREHASWDTWHAATGAMNAVPTGQVVCITNQGDDSSIVLESLRSAALGFIETGVGDPRLGLLEWSAPEGSDPTDLAALAQANPNLGHRIDPDALLGAGMRAKAAGGAELAGYLTETMCIKVRMMDPAVDPTSWERCGTTTPLDLAQHRDKLAVCVDVSLDGSHASLIGAAVIGGKVHAEVIAQWHGAGCTAALRRELVGIVQRVRPRTIGWFPAGPAAAVAADLAERRDWPPRRVGIEEIRGDQAAVCMGLAELVTAGEVVHPDDPLMNAHIAATTRQRRGDSWVFQRRGTGPIDAAYALAGAVHLARTLPPPPPPLVAL